MRFGLIARKLKSGELRIGVNAVMQVGAKSAEICRKNLKGAVGIDVVLEEELRNKGFLGIKENEARVYNSVSLLLVGRFGEVGYGENGCGA